MPEINISLAYPDDLATSGYNFTLEVTSLTPQEMYPNDDQLGDSQGIMKPVWVSAEIVSAKIFIFTPNITDDFNTNMKKSIIMHEIGHLFGLKDNPSNSYTADTNNDSSAKRCPVDSLMCYICQGSGICLPQEFDLSNIKYLYNLD